MRDLGASLQVCAIDFELGGHWFSVPPLPAARWLIPLLGNDLTLIVTAEPEGLIDADQATEIDQLLVYGTVDMDELRFALYDVVSAVAGRDWWEAVSLVATVRASDNWARLHGKILAAIDPHQVSLGAWLDVAMSLCTERMDAKQYGRFLGILQTPPAEVGLDEEREGENFLAMMNQT